MPSWLRSWQPSRSNASRPARRPTRTRPRLEELEKRTLLSFVFGGSFPSGAKPFGVASAYVNHDGRADIACANSDDNNVSVLLGNGDGSFQAAKSFATGQAPRAVVIGDFNGDGRPDLATPNTNSASVSVLLGNGDGSFQAQRTFSVGTSPTARYLRIIPPRLILLYPSGF